MQCIGHHTASSPTTRLAACHALPATGLTVTDSQLTQDILTQLQAIPELVIPYICLHPGNSVCVCLSILH